MSPSSESITRLMADFRQGDKHAAHGLVEMFYPQLHRMAASRMKVERQDHSWHPTVLVNELFLELLKVKCLRASDGQDERAAFLRLSAHLMKRLLIHHARRMSFKITKVELDECELSDSGIEELAELEQVLSALQEIRPRLRAIVELRVFDGLTRDEIASRLGCASATVTREWIFARNWLEQQFALSGAR
jgi:RNA polymerase sigma factor (TIGR02999 family)